MDKHTAPRIRTGISPQHAELIRAIESNGDQLLALVQKMEDMVELLHVSEAPNKRFLDIGKGQVQIGLMALTRSVAETGRI